MDKLDEQLAEIAKLSRQGILHAADEIQRQAPDVVHQMLVWNATASFLCWLLGLALLAALWPTWTRVMRWHRGVSKDYEDVATVTCVMGFLVHAIAGVLLFFHSFDWLMILVAPKFYVVQYVIRLLGQR